MYKKYRPVIKSRHPSHSKLRSRNGRLLSLLPFKSVIRFGSSKELDDTIINGGNRIELNTIEAIKNSSNKLLMKTCFTNDEVKTADWYLNTGSNFMKSSTGEDKNIEELPYPIISKHIRGSRGTGNKKHNNLEELQTWIEGKDLSNYIFEKFYNYNREYRLHVSKDGCFYTCRKMLKRDCPVNKRWFKNDSNSVWIMEENDSFDKPVNWDIIVVECIKALTSVGLDFGAIDLRIQSSKNNKDVVRDDPKFIIVEINSAPSFGEVTLEKYIEVLPKLLIDKYEEI
jgi:D-alanine-D-alanine ligase-like ATP-grasp enzyme